MPEREKECKHNLGFVYAKYLKPQDEILGTFTCKIGCGFCLNFDPDQYELGIAIVQREEEKLSTELVASKY